MFDFDDIDPLREYLSQYEPESFVYGPGSGWGQDTLSAMGATNDTSPGFFNSLIGAVRSIPGIGSVGADLLRQYGPSIGGALTSRGGIAGLAALLAARERQRDSGGGVRSGYAGYKPLTRTMTQGRYGPVARYAADGGLMQAYAQGGAVRPFPMQDGGFVMTKRAVDGAGGPQGMQQRVPEAVPIRGPGHGTSDSIPAYIQGANGRTPAKVSNGEMYVPPGRNTQGLYALMRSLERKA